MGLFDFKRILNEFETSDGNDNSNIEEDEDYNITSNDQEDDSNQVKDSENQNNDDASDNNDRDTEDQNDEDDYTIDDEKDDKNEDNRKSDIDNSQDDNEEYNIDDEDPQDQNNDDASDNNDGNTEDQNDNNTNSSNIKELEDKIFDQLTPEQKQIKVNELKDRFIELYDRCNGIIDRISNIEKNSDDIKVFDFINKTLMDLKNLCKDYMSKTFDTNSYIENNITYQKCLVVLQGINDILATLKSSKE